MTDLIRAEIATGLGLVLAGLSDAITDFLIHLAGGLTWSPEPTTS